MIHKRSQAGDTIVEVLLALAVIGMILGGAYSAATRSLRGGRRAQERTEATKVVESQIERIKYLTNQDNDGGVFTDTPSNKFCIDTNLVRQDEAHVSCDKVGTSGLYDVVATHSINGTQHSFEIKAVWEVQGGGSDQVSIIFNIQP